MKFFNTKIAEIYKSIPKINMLLGYVTSLPPEEAVKFRKNMANIDIRQIESVVETFEFHKKDIAYSLVQIDSIIEDLEISKTALKYLKNELIKLRERFERLEENMCIDLLESGKMSAMRNMFCLKLDLLNLENKCFLNHILENPDKFDLVDYNDGVNINNLIEKLQDRILYVSNIGESNQEALCEQFDFDEFSPSYYNLKELLNTYQNRVTPWSGWDWDKSSCNL